MLGNKLKEARLVVALGMAATFAGCPMCDKKDSKDSPPPASKTSTSTSTATSTSTSAATSGSTATDTSAQVTKTPKEILAACFKLDVKEVADIVDAKNEDDARNIATNVCKTLDAVHYGDGLKDNTEAVALEED